MNTANLSAKPTIDPSTHRRLLRFLNTARTAEDLAFAPTNEYKADPQETLKRPDVDEPMEPRARTMLLEREIAHRMLVERDRISPLHGFMHLDQLLGGALQATVARHLPDLLMHLSAASYGEWVDGAAIQTPDTHQTINVVHAAVLHTGWVMFIEAACNIPVSRTPIWNPADGEIRLPPPPTENLYCCGHSFLSDGKLLAVGGGCPEGPGIWEMSV